MASIKTTPKKIQKIGYTYVVSLPPFWIRNLELKKGDLIDIDILDDRSLMVKKHEIIE
jgi:antitoxin component of MazEF toxin-antitoxin module